MLNTPLALVIAFALACIWGAVFGSSSRSTRFVFGVLACAAVMGFAEMRFRQAMDEIASRPPIAVIPVSQYVTSRLSSDPSAVMRDEVAHVRDVAKRLAESGYVVLDRRVVYSYPNDIEVQP